MIGVVALVGNSRAARSRRQVRARRRCRYAGRGAIRRTGRPSASLAAWIFVLSPPRDRPRPWASGPLFLARASGVLMCSHNCAVDHQPFQIGFARQNSQHRRARPSRSSYNTAASRSIVAQPLWQITPAPTRTRHPQKSIQKPSVVGARAALPFGSARHKSFDTFPLVVAKRVTIHRRSPKISVESDLRAFGNPCSLIRHYDLASPCVERRTSRLAK